jgi:hypothetical protein
MPGPEHPIFSSHGLSGNKRWFNAIKSPDAPDERWIKDG